MHQCTPWWVCHAFEGARSACALPAARKEANRTCTNHHQGESHCSSTLAFSHAPHSRNSPGQFASAFARAAPRPHYNTKCIKSTPTHKVTHGHAALSHFFCYRLYKPERTSRPLSLTVVIAHRSGKIFSWIDTVLRPRVVRRGARIRDANEALTCGELWPGVTQNSNYLPISSTHYFSPSALHAALYNFWSRMDGQVQLCVLLQIVLFCRPVRAPCPRAALYSSSHIYTAGTCW